MAFGTVSLYATASSKTAGTSVNSGANSANVPAAGDFVIVHIYKDNTSTTDGDNGEVTSVTDSVGNSYQKIAEETRGTGSAAGGATVSIWGSSDGAGNLAPITNAFVSNSTTVTANFASCTAKGISVVKCSVAAGVTIAVDGTPQRASLTNGATTFTISGMSNVEHLCLCANAFEGTTASNTLGITSPSTGYGSISGLGTSGGSATTNMTGTVFSGARAASTSESITTTGGSGDQALLYVALKEVSAGGGGPTSRQQRFTYWI